jgi:hypothetical protein
MQDLWLLLFWLYSLQVSAARATSTMVMTKNDDNSNNNNKTATTTTTTKIHNDTRIRKWSGRKQRSTRLVDRPCGWRTPRPKWRSVTSWLCLLVHCLVDICESEMRPGWMERSLYP